MQPSCIGETGALRKQKGKQENAGNAKEKREKKEDMRAVHLDFTSICTFVQKSTDPFLSFKQRELVSDCDLEDCLWVLFTQEYVFFQNLHISLVRWKKCGINVCGVWKISKMLLETSKFLVVTINDHLIELMPFLRQHNWGQPSLFSTVPDLCHFGPR